MRRYLPVVFALLVGAAAGFVLGRGGNRSSPAPASTPAQVPFTAFWLYRPDPRSPHGYEPIKLNVYAAMHNGEAYKIAEEQEGRWTVVASPHGSLKGDNIWTFYAAPGKW